jgi:hypothetical protein
VLLGELPVPLVFPWHRHDGARAVAHEHVVGDEERDLGAAERVHHPCGEALSSLRSIRGRPLDLGLTRCFRPEGSHRPALLLVGHQLVHQGVLRGEHRVRHAEGRVGARGEDAQSQPGPADHRKVKFRPVTPADPVALHG